MFEYRFEPGVSHRPYFVTRPVALWLQRRLKISEVDRKGDRPETHVSEWAQAHNAPMDRGYSNEQREGGAMALGTEIPVPSRQDPNVVEPGEWRRDHTYWF